MPVVVKPLTITHTTTVKVDAVDAASLTDEQLQGLLLLGSGAAMDAVAAVTPAFATVDVDTVVTGGRSTSGTATEPEPEPEP